MDSSGKLCVLAIRLFWYVFHEWQSNEGNEHQNSTRVSEYSIYHENTHII